MRIGLQYAGKANADGKDRNFQNFFSRSRITEIQSLAGVPPGVGSLDAWCCIKALSSTRSPVPLQQNAVDSSAQH